MPLRKAPAADLRRQRPLHVLLGTALALAVVAAAFTVPVRSAAEAAPLAEDVSPLTLVDVPPTDHAPPPPPPPPAPPPPQEVPDEVAVEDIVEAFELDPLEDVPAPAGPPAPPVAPPSVDLPPPPPPVDDLAEADEGFLPVAEVQPELIGGIAALQARVEYPEMARRANVEGRVVVQFVVDERGRVVDPVAVSSPHPLLSEAAVAAVRASAFRPGQQRGRPVRVRFAVPVTFRLR